MTFKELLSVSKRHEIIQSLWSGYGSIKRYYLDAEPRSVIVKEINLSANRNEHPRGWNTTVSHERKLRSYQIEMAWYQNMNPLIYQDIRQPKCLYVERSDDQLLLILEDLDKSGFDQRFQELNQPQFFNCLDWLAKFHAHFLKVTSADIWPIGTYWHLDTRKDEWNRMEDGWLKTSASKIDFALNSASFQTIVHGDAKVANFCFNTKENSVAAVDFQYVGHGCGMKDVAYLMSSCLSAEDCFTMEETIFHRYFSLLKTYSKLADFEKLEEEWRKLYPLAWADFARFLLGWVPDHYKLNAYSSSKIESAKNLV